MQTEEKDSILEIVNTLKVEGKNFLARYIEENQEKTLLKYSEYLNKYNPKQALEGIMIKAIKQELCRLEYSSNENTKIINWIKKHRFIQTAPHISPAQKPRYFFINYLSSLSLKKDDYYIVMMFSGVPFSNKTRPGRVLSNKEEWNLIPSINQDTLAYNFKITEKVLENYEKLPDKVKKIILKPKLGESYTKWALQSTQKIENKIFKPKTLFLDFNQIIKNYTLEAFKDAKHPICEILFNKNNLKKLEEYFPNEVFFYANTQKGKYQTMTSFYLKNQKFTNGEATIPVNKKTLTDLIEKEELCIGLPLGFFVISFLNHFLCGGSFAQVEYLPMYKNKFLNFKIDKKYKIEESPFGALTTGGFYEDIDLHPLDVLLEKKKLNKYNKTLFAKAILAIKDVLLKQNYSHNMIK